MPLLLAMQEKEGVAIRNDKPISSKGSVSAGSCFGSARNAAVSDNVFLSFIHSHMHASQLPLQSATTPILHSHRRRGLPTAVLSAKNREARAARRGFFIFQSANRPAPIPRRIILMAKINTI